jgi:hypothetical protein
MYPCPEFEYNCNVMSSTESDSALRDASVASSGGCEEQSHLRNTRRRMHLHTLRGASEDRSKKKATANEACASCCKYAPSCSVEGAREIAPVFERTLGRVAWSGCCTRVLLNSRHSSLRKGTPASPRNSAGINPAQASVCSNESDRQSLDPCANPTPIF